MSSKGVGESISIAALRTPEIARFSPESFRVRDFVHAVPVGINGRRTHENNESHSPLGLWMREESPFSHRHLMVEGKRPVQRKYLEPSLVDELRNLRTEFTSDGYRSIVDVMVTVDEVRKEIKNNQDLSQLTVREKNALLERLGLYEEHFNKIESGVSHAKFSEGVKGVVGKVNSELDQVLEEIRKLNQRIKVEIRPSLADIGFLLV